MKSPEMQPPLIGREDSHKKESITLPNNQTITVRGSKQIRTLRLLITAFNQGKPHVSIEELLGLDITKGISPSRMQTRPLYSVTDRLNKTLTRTGWNIQSVTVTGPRVKTRPRGYTLKKDQEKKSDVPKSYLRNILDDETIIKELVTNGQEKDSILEKVRQINAQGLKEKVLFLEKIFAILSDPNTEHQDQRDAALELLNIMDLKNIGPKELTRTYVRAVYYLLEELNQDSDPYGEIHMLLEAGKIIAPFIENGRGITQSWNRIARVFTGNDRQKILDGIKEIKKLTPAKISAFDAKVIILMEKGLRNKDIAEKLGVEVLGVQESTHRLRRRGMKLESPNRGKGRR